MGFLGVKVVMGEVLDTLKTVWIEADCGFLWMRLYLRVLKLIPYEILLK